MRIACRQAKRRVSSRREHPCRSSFSSRTCKRVKDLNWVDTATSEFATRKLKTTQRLDSKKRAFLFDRLTPFILSSLAFSVLYFSFTGDHGLLYLKRLNEKVEHLSNRNTELKSEIATLEHRIYFINNKDFYLEKKAREELGLSKAGEKVYLFDG